MRHLFAAGLAFGVFALGLVAGGVEAADSTERRTNTATTLPFDLRLIDNGDGTYSPSVIPYAPGAYGKTYVVHSTRTTTLVPSTVTLNGVGFDWSLSVSGPAHSSATFIVNSSTPVVIIAGEPGWLVGDFGGLGANPVIVISNLTAGATAQAVIKGAR